MKKIIFLIFLCISLFGNTQTFNRTFSPVENLAGAVGTCAAPGTEDVSWYRLTVSGVGVLNTTSNTLSAITIELDNSCTGTSANLRLLQLRIKSPTGVCLPVYWGDNVSGNDATISLTGTQRLTLVTPQFCTQYPNDANTGSGNSNGVYGAHYNNSGVDSPSNLQSAFDGVTANGDWQFIFSEGTIDEPCLKSIGLIFGDVSIHQAIDETSNGNTCASPIINMCRSSICATTNGKNNEANSPGADQINDVNTTVFNNGTCAWNNANNNDTWVKFLASSTTMTITVTGQTNQIQSIVVTNPSGDGSACPTLGTAWNYVSCPRNVIYTTTSGGEASHSHTFATVVGQYYYLVVDGTGGVESPFYMNIQDRTACTILPITIGHFSGQNYCRENKISWSTLSERNNDYFIIEEKIGNGDFTEVGRINGAGNSSSENNYEFTTSIYNLSEKYHYYKLTQVDFDGKQETFDLISVETDCQNQSVFYSNNKILITGNDDIENIIIFDMIGRKVLETSESSIDFNNFASAFYNVFVINKNGKQTSNKIFKP